MLEQLAALIARNVTSGLERAKQAEGRADVDACRFGDVCETQVRSRAPEDIQDVERFAKHLDMVTGQTARRTRLCSGGFRDHLRGLAVVRPNIFLRLPHPLPR